MSVTGRVTEYRSRENDLFLTELDQISSVETLSLGHTVAPLILGVDRTPPRNQLSSFDTGPDGWLSIPNNVTLLESVNANLRPDDFGLDFWESLEGQLVTVPYPIAANFPDRFGSVWVYGDWPVTGKNERGGLTIHSDTGTSVLLLNGLHHTTKTGDSVGRWHASRSPGGHPHRTSSRRNTQPQNYDGYGTT